MRGAYQLGFEKGLKKVIGGSPEKAENEYSQKFVINLSRNWIQVLWVYCLQPFYKFARYLLSDFLSYLTKEFLF
jgi:hypothetical protein